MTSENNGKVITRFAPSPTGLIHIGNARTALISWLYARSQNGKFILRIDDTDTKRSQDRYVKAIKEDLNWLGVNWDTEFHQHTRMDKYEEAKKILIDSGRLYPCYETEEELAIKKKNLLNRNLPPIYDRAALKLTDKQKKEYEARGIKPYWRFLLHDEEIKWHDKVKGELLFSANKLSDPVLIRADNTLTYSLASVVDDIDYKITDIIRGEDHVSNSAMHIQLFQALNASPPQFAHLSLIKTKEQQISKRTGGFDLQSLRNNEIEPLVIISFLSRIGSSDPIQNKYSLEEIISEFDLKKYSKSTVNYDEQDLFRLNKKYIHEVEYSAIKKHLLDLNMDYIDKDFWYSVRSNLDKISDAKLWWDICHSSITPKITDIQFTSYIATLLPKEKWNENTWDTWIANIQKNLNKKGKELYMPIRLALTGQPNGPELKTLILLLGKEKVISRLNNSQG